MLRPWKKIFFFSDTIDVLPREYKKIAFVFCTSVIVSAVFPQKRFVGNQSKLKYVLQQFIYLD